MIAFYFIDSVLKQSQMLADRRDPKGVMFTGLTTGHVCGIKLVHIVQLRPAETAPSMNFQLLTCNHSTMYNT